MELGITREFLENLQSIDGWLYDDAVLVTASIMHTMKKFGLRGPNFEIGVFKGKYLSAIHHCSRVYNDPSTKSFGWDIFAYCDENEHRKTFCRLFDTDRDVRVIMKDSIRSFSEEIVETCGEKPAFISIDGNHRYRPVIHDHVECADALARGGVISSDDYQNWNMAEVAPAVTTWLSSMNTHRMVPFAFTPLKLFSCHHEWHERYRRGIFDLCEAMPDHPACAKILRCSEANHYHEIEVVLGEQPCLIFAP